MARPKQTHRPTASQVPRPVAQTPRNLSIQLVAFVALTIAGIVTYYNSFSVPFVYDGVNMIELNPAVRDVWYWLGFRGNMHSSSDDRPIGFLTFALNYAWSGYNVWGYHVVNLAIHVGAGWLLFDVTRRTLLRPKIASFAGAHAGGLALAIALVWIVHPLHTQSVTYIYQRLESLMGLFYLAALWCFLRALDSPRRRWWFAASVASCALGMGTKEVMVTAPVLILLYDRVFVAESWRSLFTQRVGYYATLAATWGILAGLMIAHADEYVSSGVMKVEGVSPLKYALSQPGVILHYLRLAFWPDELCLDYRWPVATTVVAIVPPALLIGAFLAISFWASYRGYAWGCLGLFFFLLLSPTSSVAPIVDLAVEYRMYLPLAAIVALAVCAVYAIGRNVARRTNGPEQQRSFWERSLPAILVLAVVVPLCMRTIRRNADYESELKLWQMTAAQQPENARAHTNLSRQLNIAGQLPAALDESNLAIQFDKDYALAYNNRGDVLLKLGLAREAYDDFSKAIELGAGAPQVYYNRGNALVAQASLDEALADYGRAIDLAGDFASAYHNRGVVFSRQKQHQRAIDDFTRAIDLQPDLAEAYVNRAAEHQALDEPRLVVKDCNQAIKLNAQFGPAYAQRAMANYRLGRYGEARNDVQTAARLGAPLNPDFLRALEAASNRGNRPASSRP